MWIVQDMRNIINSRHVSAARVRRQHSQYDKYIITSTYVLVYQVYLTWSVSHVRAGLLFIGPERKPPYTAKVSYTNLDEYIRTVQSFILMPKRFLYLCPSRVEIYAPMVQDTYASTVRKVESGHYYCCCCDPMIRKGRLTFTRSKSQATTNWTCFSQSHASKKSSTTTVRYHIYIYYIYIYIYTWVEMPT